MSQMIYRADLTRTKTPGGAVAPASYVTLSRRGLIATLAALRQLGPTGTFTVFKYVELNSVTTLSSMPLRTVIFSL